MRNMMDELHFFLKMLIFINKLLRFNIVDPKTDENVAYVEVPTHRTDEIRVDFNPKRLRWDLTSEWAQFLIWFLQQLKIKNFRD